MSYVLGISAYYHESSTCLIDSRSGKVFHTQKKRVIAESRGTVLSLKEPLKKS